MKITSENNKLVEFVCGKNLIPYSTTFKRKERSYSVSRRCENSYFPKCRHFSFIQKIQ